MQRTCSEEEREQAVAAVLGGMDIEEKAGRLGVPAVELARWCLASLGSSAGQRRRGGSKPKLDDNDLAALRELVEARPRLTQRELAEALAERRGKKVSVPTISKALKKLGFRKVKLQKAASKPAPQSPPRYTDQHRREPTATTYPSTLTDREWEVLEPLLAKKDGRGRPPTHSKRVLMDAIFYQVRTGNQWRYLPKDFPPWEAVWSLFRRVRDNGVLEKMYEALHEQWRTVSGREPEPTAGIVDSRTVKTTEKGGSAATTPARSSRAARSTSSPTRSDSPAQQ